ncbi:hypothetical protein SLS53_008051 [Cytospora paraplurivora]|uniref:Uncharacterized protein n=1 Tax=Cytospora paraplurivora TaxID=2898453 RepID=A0AAN9YD52_9PEZI
MERDVRRDRGQWRGCYEFKNIICDGNQPATARRNGGLKMGQPYYYYYELDGSLEAHDPSRPTTSACPYLPGQTVNMMHVPAEMPNRKRSASVSSVRDEDFKTMDPNHKFITPRPAPSVPDASSPGYRPVTSHAHDARLLHKRSDRSISPTPSWWSPRKLFTRKNSSSSIDRHSDRGSESQYSCDDPRRSVVSSSSSEGSRMRPLSPDSLRRFLVDDMPAASEPIDDAERLFLSIPDDIAEEDDDNFATSAVSENGIRTILSPPPPVSRNNTPNGLRRLPENGSAVTIREYKPTTAIPQLRPAPFIHDQLTPSSRFSFSSDEGSILEDEIDCTSPEAEAYAETEIPSFYHSEADEEDDKDFDTLSPPANPPHSRSGLHMGRDSLEQSLAAAFKGYRLPLTSIEGGKGKPASAPPAGADASVSVLSSPPLLAAPLGSVVDDFVSEMSGCLQSRWGF